MASTSYNIRLVNGHFPFVGRQLGFFFRALRDKRGYRASRNVYVRHVTKDLLRRKLHALDHGSQLLKTPWVGSPLVKGILFAVSAEHEELARLTAVAEDTSVGRIFSGLDPRHVNYLCYAVRVVLPCAPLGSASVPSQYEINLTVLRQPRDGFAHLLKSP